MRALWMVWGRELERLEAAGGGGRGRLGGADACTADVVLALRSAYFRGLFLSGMQGVRSEGGVQAIALGEVSAGALRVVLRYPCVCVCVCVPEELGEPRKRSSCV